MIERLESSRELFRSTASLIDQKIEPLAHRFGFTEERMQQMYEQLLTEANAYDQNG